MPHDDDKSLGDAATFAGHSKPKRPQSDVSLGDERTLGGGGMGGNRMAVQRFLTESEPIVALNHPHVVQIHDYGCATDGPFLIMEYVDGGSLLDRQRIVASQMQQSGIPCDRRAENGVDAANSWRHPLSICHEVAVKLVAETR